MSDRPACEECGDPADRRVSFAGSSTGKTHHLCEGCLAVHRQSGAVEADLPLKSEDGPYDPTGEFEEREEP